MKKTIFILLLLIVNTVFWNIAYHYQWITAAENSLMENFQIFELSIAAIIFAVLAFINKEKTPRIFYSVFSFLNISFILREMDFEGMDVFPVLHWASSGIGFIILMLIGWFTLALLVFSVRKKFWTLFKKWAKSAAGVTMIAAGGLLYLSMYLDKKAFKMSGATAQFWEELIEINAFLLIIASALICLMAGRFIKDYYLEIDKSYPA